MAEAAVTGKTDLKGASIGVIAGTLGSYFASNIGMMHAHGLGDAEANLVHKTLHALNGAGQGLIMGVGKGILSQKGVTAEVLGEAVALAAAGALGSLVAETVADGITPTGGIAHQSASARPSAERIIATQAAARIVAGAVAMLAGMSPDQIQTAIFTATTAVENNAAKSATQAGQGKTKQTDDNGYDTNDEAEQSFVGKGRRAVLKAIGLEKVGQIIDDFRQKLGVDRTLVPIAAYPTDISVGEDAYIGACLDWTRDHVYERPMTTDETQVYRSVCKHAYMKMRENGAGQGPLSAAATIATMIGNGVEAVLCYTGMTDKGNARAIGQSINDGLALYGLASIGKVGVQGLARQAKGLGKGAGATEGVTAKLKLSGVSETHVHTLDTKIVNFSRELQASDLGVKGNLSELRGNFSINDKIATVRIDMIRGKIDNPFQIIGNLSKTALSNGAEILKIEGTIANPRLYEVLSRRYGMVTKGSDDCFILQLK